MVAYDFNDHHHRGQRHDAPGAPFMLAVMGAKKGVAVGPLAHRVQMHV
jgi:hypothetical protein